MLHLLYLDARVVTVVANTGMSSTMKSPVVSSLTFLAHSSVSCLPKKVTAAAAVDVRRLGLGANIETIRALELVDDHNGV